MKKRILCGLLAVLLIVQSVPLQTYAAESLPETILEDNGASAMDEMDSETEKGDLVTDEVLPTETPETVQEEIPTSKPESEATVEPTVVPEVGMEVDETEEPTVIPAEEPSVIPEGSVIEIPNEENIENEIELVPTSRPESIINSEIETFSETNTPTIDTSVENTFSIYSDSNELANISNIFVEKIGYQYAKIVFDVICTEGVTIDEYLLYGGVICSEPSLSTDTIQRLYIYYDENGNKIDNRFYTEVKIHSEKTYIYTPFVQVIDENEEEQIVTANNSVEITGKKFGNMNPSLQFDSGITKAILWLSVTDYDYDLEGYLDADVYYRKKNDVEWIRTGSVQSSQKTNKVVIDGLSPECEYETYVEIIDKSGTGNVVQTNICSFRTEGDIVYNSDYFPDEVFYKYILKKCGGEQITKSKLNKILSISISEDDIENGIPINNLEGIQYLENLEGLYVTGQDIEEASMISELKYLETIDLSSNELKKLPDMSEMEYLRRIDFDYNKISESEIIISKLPLNSEIQNSGNWTKMSQHQVANCVDVKVPPKSYGWGDSQPIVIGTCGLKNISYNIVITIDDIKYEITKNGYISNYEGQFNPYVIPNTGLDVGTYNEVKVEIYDIYNRKKHESLIDITLVEDKSTISTGELGEKTTNFSIDGELLGANKSISTIKLVRENEVYGETSYVHSYPTLDDEERYADFFYGSMYGTDIPSSEFACERNAVKYISTIYLNRELEIGDYDLEFLLEDGTVISEKDVISINLEPRVYSVEKGSGYNEHEYLFDNTGEYIYVIVRGYQLDTEKVWPEIYIDNTIVSTYDGLELREETGFADMEYYVYRLKKLEVDKYWKKNQAFRWRLKKEEGYLCNDLATEHGFSYTYENGIEFGLFWVDEHLKEDTCKFYLNSSLPNETIVKVTAYEAPSYTDFMAYGEGKIQDGKIIIDFYDKNNQIYYPQFNANCFVFEFIDGENIFVIKKQPTVYYYTGMSSNMTDVHSNLDYSELCVCMDENPDTVYGVQWGTNTEIPYNIGIYLPNSNKKILSLDITQSNIGNYKSYFFSHDDIAELDENEIYRIDIKDKSGKRLLKRFYSYITSKRKTDLEIIFPTSIKVNKNNIILNEKDALQLTATILPSNATNKSVIWNSSDQTVATVDPNGLVTAVGVGKTVITATTSNGKTATCTVTVYQSEGGEITLKPGDTYQLTVPEGISASDAVYQSDNTSVATVSSKGLVTAVGTGNAIITFKSGSVTITYNVIVSNPLESISFEEAEVTLEVDETVTNGILLKPVNTDTEIAFVVTVGDENVAEAALLNGLVQIKGKAAGTTKVTVSNGELKAECEVTVLDKMTIPDTSEHMVYALTNKDKTLADISDQLLPGFTFKNPEIKLSPFAGVSQKDFAVIYTDENGRTSQSVQKVNLLTINGINPVLDSKTVKADGSNQAVLSVEVLWKGYDADDSIKAKILEKYHFEVTPDKAGIVNITEENGNYIIAGAKTGKVKINVLYRENGAQGNTGILYQKKLDMAVVSKMADIQLEVLGAEYHAEGDYYYVTDIKAAVSLKAVAEGYKLTWKASDTGIAKIGKAKGGVSAVTLKNNGKVKLTVTANDSGKTAKSIILYVMDAKPSVDGSVTVNKASEVGGTLGIYGSYGYDIEKYDVQLLQKADVTQKEERFSIHYNEEKDVYEVNVTDRSAVTAGKYPVTVKITAQTETGEKEYLENVTITVTDKVAAYNVKQSKKVNLFYADATGNGKLSLTSKKAVVESVTLSDCDFSYDYQTGEIQFTGKDYKTADKNGILSIKLKGYHEIKKNITINTEVKKPGVSVSASSSTVYPNAGIVKAQLQLTNKNTKETLAVEAKNITQPNLLKDAYQVYAEDGQLMLKLKDGVTAPKTAKIKVSVKMDGWNESVSLTHTVKSSTTKTVKLQLSGSKVTINKNDAVSRYQQAEIKVRAQGATESDRIQTVSVNGADKKSIQAMNEGLKFNFDGETGILTVTISNGQALTKTTYSFNVRAEISEGKYATAKLKVTIVDKAPESLLSVTCKGSIDVFDRENSYVTCTPKVKNLSGKITGVSLTGRDAHLFEAEMNESGKTIIKAKEGVAYITKYAYKAQPVYEISSGDRTYTVAAKTISLKLKQTKSNLTTSLSSQYLYQASDNKLNVSVMALNSKGKGLNVRNMELVETKAIKDAFELIYDEQADSYQLTVKDVSKVKKGKSYKLKLNVYLNEQADNEKAYPVTVTVTVK